MAESEPRIVLYDDGACQYTHRTRICLEELGVVYETKLVPMVGEKPDWFLAINPKGQVPTITADGVVLTESVVIVNYLSEAFAHRKRLFPAAALDRARMHQFIWFAKDAIWGFLPKILMNGRADEREKLKADYLDRLGQVSAHLATLHPIGPFACGADFTVADCVFAPHMIRLYVLEHFENFVVPDTPEFSRLRQWRRAVEAHPSVQRTQKPLEEYYQIYQGFVDLRAKPMPVFKEEKRP